MKKELFFLMSSLCISVSAIAQTAEGSINTFRHPDPVVESLTMAAPAPTTTFNSSMTKAVIASRDCRHVPIAELAPNEVKIAGLRINTETFSLNRENYNEKLEIVDVATGVTTTLAGVPQNAKIKHIKWSPSGKYLCFTNLTDKGVDLYRADISAANPVAKKINTLRVNTILGTPYYFLSDEEILYVSVPKENTVTPKQDMPTSNVVQEVLGKSSRIMTYQDLMKGPFDEVLYDYLCTSILAIYSPEGTRTIGEKAIYRSLDPSPDGRYIITTTEHKPYSYMEAHRSFPSKQFIMDLDGNVVKMLNDGTRKDEKKADEPKGPKPGDKDAKDVKPEKKAPKPSGFAWRADLPATLVWNESEGNGGPGGFPGGGPMGPPPTDGDKDKDNAKKEKEPEKTFKDRMYQTEAPFDFENNKTLVLVSEFSMGRVTWGNSSIALYQDTSRDKKIRRTITFKPCDTLATKHILFEQTTETDTTGTLPVFGSALTVANSYGKNVLWTDAKASYLYLSGTNRRDAEGWPYAFLDKITLKDGKITNVWADNSEDQVKEALIGVSDFKNLKVVVSKEQWDVVPNYYETTIKKGTSRQITQIESSVPQLSDLMTMQTISYTRKDGLKCFGNLYLPKGYDKEKDGRLPVLMWTYPYEYKTPAECDKSRVDRFKYVKPSYASAMTWASQGYAVLNDFTMAIIPAHKDSLENDVFLEQLIMSAESAIDCIVDSLGIGDRERIGVGGHSYGGFMTANLLAHTKLFRAGVARSGAYNRSLTPFGFQSERRTYWKAKDVYDEMSPFNYADKIKDALLIIHGQQDDNTGTFPVQSERLYQALVYFGGTSRFVYMPFEAHSYYGLETTLDMLYETGRWLDKYVKNAEPRKKDEPKGDKKEGPKD